MMKRLKCSKIVRVGQNWFANNRNDILVGEMFQSFQNLSLVDKFILQFDLACEPENFHPKELLALQLVSDSNACRLLLRWCRMLEAQTFKTHCLSVAGNARGDATIKHYNNDVAMSVHPSHDRFETSKFTNS